MLVGTHMPEIFGTRESIKLGARVGVAVRGADVLVALVGVLLRIHSRPIQNSGLAR